MWKLRGSENFMKIKSIIKNIDHRKYTTSLDIIKNHSKAFHRKNNIHVADTNEKNEEDDIKLTKEEGLHEIDAEISAQSGPVFYLKKFFYHKNEFKTDYETQALVSFVEELEKITIDLNQDLDIMKDQQISRIGKEFLVNDYERIYRVNIDIVISAIVGERSIRKELKNFILEKKNYYESIKLCRNFN